MSYFFGGRIGREGGEWLETGYNFIKSHYYDLYAFEILKINIKSPHYL